MKNKIFSDLFVCTVASKFAAPNWLDVTPQAQVNADKLFSTPEGYESAVYGIYTAMTDASIYGTHMTFRFYGRIGPILLCLLDKSLICMNVPNTIITMEPPKT